MGSDSGSVMGLASVVGAGLHELPQVAPVPPAPGPWRPIFTVEVIDCTLMLPLTSTSAGTVQCPLCTSSGVVTPSKLSTQSPQSAPGLPPDDDTVQDVLPAE